MLLVGRPVLGAMRSGGKERTKPRAEAHVVRRDEAICSVEARPAGEEQAFASERINEQSVCLIRVCFLPAVSVLHSGVMFAQLRQGTGWVGGGTETHVATRAGELSRKCVYFVSSGFFTKQSSCFFLFAVVGRWCKKICGRRLSICGRREKRQKNRGGDRKSVV